MPSCLRQVKLTTGLDPVYVDGPTYVTAWLLVPDTTTTDLSKCFSVSLSGAEYQSLSTRIDALEARPASSGSGGSAVNVSADIFVGALLVVCFVLGWIAGGQR